MNRRTIILLTALIFFILTFIVARTFTTISPNRILTISGIHIHHYVLGIILLAIGGLIGLAYHKTITDIVAASLYGIGAGLITDEIGLLILGDYWTTFTYYIFAIIIVIIAIVAITALRAKKANSKHKHAK